ncbi:hypothetical protein BG015_001525 [Linnemannia schmuckeri]|uniref:F-box domain-containing protein n=1 Tax=Linnemannia schmuckeri TaxID=64567 RepID=A0A9P5RQ44_9FUNG|nr:hypothetical protein BG015_001525 [Linnemannia schmuckeri]
MSTASFASFPPEVITLIASHLNQHDLAQCLRLSHKWFAFFTPLFWQDVHVDDRLHKNNGLGYLIRNRHRIRDLQLSDPQATHFLALGQQGEGQLRSLSASFQRETVSFLAVLDAPQPWTTEDYLSDQAGNLGNTRSLELILTRNWNLRSLTMDESCFRNKNGGDAFNMIMAVCPVARLERLEIRFGRNPNRRAQPEEEPTGPTSFVMADVIAALTDRRELGFLFGSFDALKELIISGGNRHIDYNRLGFFLRCGNLERVRLEDIDVIALGSLAVALGLCCPKLTHLDWRGPPAGQDRDIAILLAGNQSGWKEISLPPDFENFGPRSFVALMRSVPTTLEVLKIGDWGRTEEEDFLEILCSARNLRRLEGPTDGKFSGRTRNFTVWGYRAFRGYARDGDDKLYRTWTLGPSMEFLQMQITNIPRPDIVCYRNGRAINSPSGMPAGFDNNAGYDVQKWIYSQLRRMTGLQELVLGTVDLDPSVLSRRDLDGLALDSIALEEALKDVFPMFNYYTLEFSLKSGLELLAGLKKLKMLDVRLTAHRIGVAELEWMHVNWPRLKTIKGLESKREWTGDAEAGLAVKTAVDAWIAAHPDGIGSYYSGTK